MNRCVGVCVAWFHLYGMQFSLCDLQVASQVGALDAGYKPGVGDLRNAQLVYLLGAVGFK